MPPRILGREKRDGNAGKAPASHKTPRMGCRGSRLDRSLGDQRLRAISPNRSRDGALGTSWNGRQLGRNVGAGLRIDDHAARARSSDRRRSGNPYGQGFARGHPSARRFTGRDGRAQRSSAHRTLVWKDYSLGARQCDGRSRQATPRASRSSHARFPGISEGHHFRRDLGIEGIACLRGPRRSQSGPQRAVETPASRRTVGYRSWR